MFGAALNKSLLDYYRRREMFSKFNYQKYYGKRAYMDKENELRLDNAQKKFSIKEKLRLLSEMIDYINKKDLDLYHDFMDIICVEKEDWFNLLIFDGKAKTTILEYIKSKVCDKQKGITAKNTIIIDNSCISNEKPLERNCTTCEFYNSVCMGSGVRTDNGENTYGMPITEALQMFPDGCQDYGISLSAYEILCARSKIRQRG